MASKNLRLVTRTTPEFRARFEKALALVRAQSGAEISEAQLVQMGVKAYIDYLDRHPGKYSVRLETYPEHKDSVAFKAAEDPPPDSGGSSPRRGPEGA